MILPKALVNIAFIAILLIAIWVLTQLEFRVSRAVMGSVADFYCVGGMPAPLGVLIGAGPPNVLLFSTSCGQPRPSLARWVVETSVAVSFMYNL
jgi:hypothetical protein